LINESENLTDIKPAQITYTKTTIVRRSLRRFFNLIYFFRSFSFFDVALSFIICWTLDVFKFILFASL